MQIPWSPPFRLKCCSQDGCGSISLSPSIRSNPVEPYVEEAIIYWWWTLEGPKPFPCTGQKYSVVSGKVSWGYRRWQRRRTWTNHQLVQMLSAVTLESVKTSVTYFQQCYWQTNTHTSPSSFAWKFLQEWWHAWPWRCSVYLESRWDGILQTQKRNFSSLLPKEAM